MFWETRFWETRSWETRCRETRCSETRCSDYFHQEKNAESGRESQLLPDLAYSVSAAILVVRSPWVLGGFDSGSEACISPPQPFLLTNVQPCQEADSTCEASSSTLSPHTACPNSCIERKYLNGYVLLISPFLLRPEL